MLGIATLMICLLMTTSFGQAQRGVRKVAYKGDFLSNILNPERGLIDTIYPAWTIPPTPTRALTDLDCLNSRKAGRSLIAVRYCIYEFRKSDLSDAFLKQVQANFDTARRNGVKLVPRFAYNYANGTWSGNRFKKGEKTDTTTTWILRHLDQLKPVLHKNEDVLAFFSAGFIGRWGEWNASSNDLLTENLDRSEIRFNDNTRIILHSILSAVPAGRMIEIRYPWLKQAYIGNARPLTAATAFYDRNPGPRARLGSHDDFFLGDKADGGTYGLYPPPTEADIEAVKSYLNKENLYVVQNGELSQDKSARNFKGSAIAKQEMQRLRFDTLNSLDAGEGIFDSWRKDGGYDEIISRLGYRFRLIGGTFPAKVVAGGPLSLTLKVANDGFGKLFNLRKLEIVLRRRPGGKTIQLPITDDPRFWSPGTTRELTPTIALPAALPDGDYDIFLNLPDTSPSLRRDPRYSARRANLNDSGQSGHGFRWEDDTGYNWLGTAVWVSRKGE
jgi:hypothetical protein